MRVHLGRVLAVAVVFIFNADRATKASEETVCQVCIGQGTYWVQCAEGYAGQSGYTGCTGHYDEYHGYHCDFSGDQCVAASN